MSAQRDTRALFHPPFTLLDFQAAHVAQMYAQRNTLLDWDTGLGKTSATIALSCLLFEDGLIDLHLVICEQNKILEWVEDISDNSDLSVISYVGPIEKRRKIVASLDSAEPVKIGRKKTDTVHRPQVLVGTYETFRNDLAETEVAKTRGGRKVKKVSPGWLTNALVGKRILVSYDEMTKIGNRGSTLHQSQVVLIKALAEAGVYPRLVGLTATPVERDPESFYNLGRILAPAAVGTVASFEADHVRYRDEFGSIPKNGAKNLTPETTFEPWVTPLSTKMAPVLLRKRKTDDDVRELFPAVVERFVKVRLSDRQQDFYDSVMGILTPEDPRNLGVLRMIAGMPWALLRSQNKSAIEIVQAVGERGLLSLGSSKLDVLVERLVPIVLGQGDQAVVFTFFGPSMIPDIVSRFNEHGLEAIGHFGTGMSPEDRERAKNAFKAGDRRVLVSSDAGQRGINLPQAGYAFEFESALNFAGRTQRLNRVHRLDSKSKFDRQIVYLQTFVALGTVEVGLLQGALIRNQWSDMLTDSDDDPKDHFVTAEMRRRLWATSRPE